MMRYEKHSINFNLFNWIAVLSEFGMPFEYIWDLSIETEMAFNSVCYTNVSLRKETISLSLNSQYASE